MSLARLLWTYESDLNIDLNASEGRSSLFTVKSPDFEWFAGIEVEKIENFKVFFDNLLDFVRRRG